MAQNIPLLSCRQLTQLCPLLDSLIPLAYLLGGVAQEAEDGNNQDSIIDIFLSTAKIHHTTRRVKKKINSWLAKTDNQHSGTPLRKLLLPNQMTIYGNAFSSNIPRDSLLIVTADVISPSWNLLSPAICLVTLTLLFSPKVTFPPVLKTAAILIWTSALTQMAIRPASIHPFLLIHMGPSPSPTPML